MRVIDPLPGDIFATGQVLNNTYEIEGVLGRGGTGEVYRAKNLIGGRVVALKALNATLSGNDAYLDLMKREEQMRDIIHDAVVRYSDNSRTDDGHVFLVMDYIDGPSLNDRLLQGGMEPRDLLVVAHRVAEGLAVTHRRSVVHRDLSPDNIILRGGDPAQAVIIDFGIAKDNSASAKTIVGDTFAGKYEYAAPEQIDGKAVPSSDLYSLGATLLATFRGQVPFQGATPGEVVRAKDKPLDTAGVPQPLREIIEWLTAVDLNDRPRDADAVVAKLDQLLKLKGKSRAKASSKTRKPWSRFRLVAGGLVAAAIILNIALFLRPDPLPSVDPFFVRASLDENGRPSLEGYAPSADAKTNLVSAFERSAGAKAPENSIDLADGLPAENWMGTVSNLLGILSELDDWSIEITNLSAYVKGVARSEAVATQVGEALENFARDGGVVLSSAIRIGPRRLDASTVEAALNGLADCGPIRTTLPQSGFFGLDDDVPVAGQISSAEVKQQIAASLKPVIGDRNAVLDLVVLNPELCKTRQILPAVGSENVSIWLGYGDTNETNLSGIFKVGENPVAEVHLPADQTDGSIWVMLVDNTNRVYHILPHEGRTEHSVQSIGEIAGGVRKIRVMFSVDEFRADPSRFAIRMSPELFGKSELFALYSDKPLFEGRRPKDESVDSMAEDLSALTRAGEIEIKAIASRLIDGRP